MDDKVELKQRKKAYNKARRRAIRPWKVLAILFFIFALLLTPVMMVLRMFDNTVAVFVGGTFWELKNEDPGAVYYGKDFSTPKDLAQYGVQLCQQVEAEGAALLMNENGALPLKEGARVSCFSGSSVNLVYGGTGSGNIDASSADTLRTALSKAGFKVNETLWSFYAEGPGSEYARDAGGMVSLTGATVAEVPMSVYTDEVKNSVADYGDAAIVVLSRVGGEGADLDYRTVNYLALDQNEKDMMAWVAQQKEAGAIGKIIVLINSANALQVDFLKDNEYGVDAALWIGDVGISGINAVADILAGHTNPSGSLVDTYCYDNYGSPAMQNFTPSTYGGYDGSNIPSAASTYMIYQEGIYVGYKYYETRYEDYVLQQGNAGDFSYGDEVAFPFGWGLSYTTFEYRDFSVSYDPGTDRFEVTVTVANTGGVAGKETVQIYARSPYTDYDREHGVEKAAVALCGFGKTQVLQPGESETLNITVDRRELASYDAYGAGTYILDAGDYYLTAATDAHNAVNNILTAMALEDLDLDVGNRMDEAGDPGLVWTWNNPALDAETYSTAANGAKIFNRLSDADLNLYEGSPAKIGYLTRSDWTSTFPQGTVELKLNDTMIADLQNVQHQPNNGGTLPTMGADNGLRLYDLIGKDYNDEQWDTLLDQMTFNEMVSLIGDSFHWTMPIASIQAPGSRDENGPQGLTASLFSGGLADVDATAFTSEDVMAATFNTELMYEIGKVIAGDCMEAGVDILYGPGNNIHRTPYGGRNFEYYSEDGFLSGEMSRYEVQAMEERGVHVVMKHFALNDCEQDRIGLGVWTNEQAAREIYLKAFQAPVEDGNGNGVMTAYTRWGCTWSGANGGLINGVLREEWGCDGLIITDNVLSDYISGVDGVLAGVSTYDSMMTFIITNQLPNYKNDTEVVNAMREACHHDLYALANSTAMNGIGANTTVKVITPTVITIVTILTCAAAFLFVVSLVLWIVNARKFMKSDIYREYKAYRKARKEQKS